MCVCVCVCGALSVSFCTEVHINALDRVQKKAAQNKTIKRLCARFKAYSGERSWKAISDRLRRPYYLSRIDRVRKIRDRKQRMDIRKYSFVNRTITTWKKLPAEALGTFSCKPEIFRKRVRKAVINGVK